MVENKCYHPHCKECKDNRCTKYLNVKDCASVKTESPKWEQDKIKKLNIIEVSNMPYGTEFKMIRNGVEMPNHVYIDNDSCLRWKGTDEPFSPYVDNFNAIFLPIEVQKPVSFTDVVNSDKRCRVEHEILTDELFSIYRTFKSYFIILSNTLPEEELKKVIKEGNWYLED